MPIGVVVSTDRKGRVVIPKEKRKATHYRLVDRGDRLELIPMLSFREMKGKYPISGVLEDIEEEVERKIIRRERKI